MVEIVYCAVRTDSLHKADYVSSLKGLYYPPIYSNFFQLFFFTLFFRTTLVYTRVCIYRSYTNFTVYTALHAMLPLR
jgi:hypothetical protein